MKDPHAEYFALLSTCLAEPPSPSLLESLAGRAKDPSLRTAHPDLDRGWRRLEGFFGAHPLENAATAVAQAHRELLGHPFAPRLEPYASQYLEGTRFGTPLVRLRGFLAEWGLVADRKRYRDLEDHAAFLFECLSHLRELEDSEGERWTEAFDVCLRDHALPWAPRFLTDLERADEMLSFGGFYSGLARIGQAILDLEASASGIR